jgi:hypothetical protein
MEIRTDAKTFAQESENEAIGQIQIINNILKKDDKIRNSITGELDFILGAVFATMICKFGMKCDRLNLIPISSESDLLNEYFMENFNKIKQLIIDQLGI